jgi:cytochrome c
MTMRNRLIVILLASAGLGFFANKSMAADQCTADEAKVMADKAIAAIKSLGNDKAYAEFSQKDSAAWHNKDCYVFVVKYDGVCVAHGGNAALVGKNVLELKDSDGEAFMKKMADQSKKGTGWVDYKWSNPTTKLVAKKSSYVLPLAGQDAFIGVGIYK